jgi:tetratricopeptide (TPR) repeat protein
VKFYILLFFSFFTFFAASAQQSSIIDSLKTRIKICKTDSAFADIYYKLADEYSETVPDSGIVYAKRSLAIYERTKEFGYQIDCLIKLGIIYRERGEYTTAIEKLQQAYTITQKHKVKDHYILGLYTAFNLAYTEQGNYTVGIEYGFKALHEVEKTHDTLTLALTNNNIANTYWQIKQYPKALKHYLIALKYAQAVKNLHGQSLLTGNIGSVYYEIEKLDSAKYYFEKCLALSIQINDTQGTAFGYSNLGGYYQKINDNKKAIDYLNKAEVMLKEMQLLPDLADVYYNLSNSYLYLKEYEKSEVYAKQALKIANSINSFPVKEEAHLALNKVFERTNNISQAYYHYKEYIAARDSIFNETNRKDQFKAEVVYEYDKKRYSDSVSHTLATQIQQKELSDEREKTETQRKFTYIAVGGCLLLLVLVIFIFKGYKDKQRANRIISEQKNQVEIQKEEIELQKSILETRNKEVTDSIRYAKRIQQSLLPTEKYIDKNLKRLKNDIN